MSSGRTVSVRSSRRLTPPSRHNCAVHMRRPVLSQCEQTAEILCESRSAVHNQAELHSTTLHRRFQQNPKHPIYPLCWRRTLWGVGRLLAALWCTRPFVHSSATYMHDMCCRLARQRCSYSPSRSRTIATSVVKRTRLLQAMHGRARWWKVMRASRVVHRRRVWP